MSEALSRKDLRFVFLGATRFSRLSQREHWLAITLAQRGFPVTYIEPPHSAAAAVRDSLRSAFAPHSLESVAESRAIPPTLRILAPPMVPTFSRSSWTPRLDQGLFHRWFARSVANMDPERTVLIVGHSHWWTGFISRKEFPTRCLVYDKADHLEVSSRTPATLRAMEAGERAVLGEADLVTFSARKMETEFGGFAGAPVYLPNAVSSQFLHALSMIPTPAERTRRIGFMGALDARWIDIDLIHTAAEELTAADFLLAGPISRKWKIALSVHKNVKIAGPMRYADVPRILREARAAIIPFKLNASTDCVNPLKLYEYMAAGLPVVATRTAELNLYSSQLLLADNAGAFVERLRETLGEKYDDHRAARITFARENTWEQRVDTLLSEIRTVVE